MFGWKEQFHGQVIFKSDSFGLPQMITSFLKGEETLKKELRGNQGVADLFSITGNAG